MFLARIGEIVSIGNHPSMIPKRWRSLELIYSSARIICTKRGWNLNPDGRLTNEKEREREEGRRRLEILQLSKSGFHAYIYTYKRDRKRIKHASTWFRHVFYSRVALTHGLIRILLIRDSNLLDRGILPLVRGEREKERECHLKRNTSIRFTCRLPLKYRTFRRNKKLRQYAGLKSGFNLNWFELIILLSSRRIGHRIPAVRYASAPFRTSPLVISPLPFLFSFPFFAYPDPPPTRKKERAACVFHARGSNEISKRERANYPKCPQPCEFFRKNFN